MIDNDVRNGRVRRKTKRGVLTVSVAALSLASGAATAQEAREVLLDATYLAAPTDWCPADAGVPMVLEMDGPDIIQGPNTFPKTVRERRGGNISIIHTEENTASFNNPEDIGGPNAEVIGRFAAEFQTCFSPWKTPTLTGSWRLIGKDGADMDQGSFENEYLGSMNSLFFRSVAGSSKAHYAQFGDRLLFTADQPAPTITQTFLAKPDKE
jgi:hypothetical protein